MNLQGTSSDPSTYCYFPFFSSTLHSLRQLPRNQGYGFKGRVVKQAEVLGFVVFLKLDKRKMEIYVDDGLGVVRSLLWFSHKNEWEDAPLWDAWCNEMMAKVQTGDLIRVQGRIKTYNGKNELSILTLQIVQDANEEMHHWIKCMEKLN